MSAALSTLVPVFPDQRQLAAARRVHRTSGVARRASSSDEHFPSPQPRVQPAVSSIPIPRTVGHVWERRPPHRVHVPPPEPRDWLGDVGIEDQCRCCTLLEHCVCAHGDYCGWRQNSGSVNRGSHPRPRADHRVCFVHTSGDGNPLCAKSADGRAVRRVTTRCFVVSAECPLPGQLTRRCYIASKGD
jgi:hypothetical protein